MRNCPLLSTCSGVFRVAAVVVGASDWTPVTVRSSPLMTAGVVRPHRRVTVDCTSGITGTQRHCVAHPTTARPTSCVPYAHRTPVITITSADLGKILGRGLVGSVHSYNFSPGQCYRPSPSPASLSRGSSFCCQLFFKLLFSIKAGSFC